MARKTKAEAEATRDEILNAAEHVFLERGVARATLENIAATAGVSRGAIYWHFQNKNDLFDAMLERVQMPMMELVERLPVEREVQPFGALRHVCSLALHKLVADPQYRRVYAILHHRCERVPDLDGFLQRHSETLERILACLEEYFSRQANRRALHPSLTPRLAARMVHIFMSGVHYDWLRDPAGYDLAEDGQALLDTMFRSLSVAGSAPAVATG